MQHQSFADIYIHLRPEHRTRQHQAILHDLSNTSGVFSVHFDTAHEQQAVIVACNPKTITADAILAIVHKQFSRAVRVATILTHHPLPDKKPVSKPLAH